MENNCKIISGFVQCKNGNIYRQYYLLYCGVVTAIQIDTNFEWVKNTYKKTPSYKNDDIKKFLKGECKLEDLKEISYREFMEVYAGV